MCPACLLVKALIALIWRPLRRPSEERRASAAAAAWHLDGARTG
jgi:hypothetical protein